MKNFNRLGSGFAALLAAVILTTPSYCDPVDDLIRQLQFQATKKDALNSLMLKGDARAVKPMFAVLEEEAADTIKNRGAGAYGAAGAIGHMRHRQDQKIIDAIDIETEGMVRQMSAASDVTGKIVRIHALGYIGSPISVHVLINLLDDNKLGGDALIALSYIKNSEAADALKKYALSKADADALRAIYALRKIATRNSLKAIDELAKKHPSAKVRKRAREDSIELISILDKKCRTNTKQHAPKPHTETELKDKNK